MTQRWVTLKEWPELVLERAADAGIARITLNRPDKRNCWNGPLCQAFLDSLDLIRADKEIKVGITRGAGKAFSSGLDLTFLRELSNAPLRDWDRPTPTIQIAEALRAFPRIMIAEVHGFCLGGALGIMNCHDLVYAADDAQLGMPEVMRGSFGQLVTSTLLHSGLAVKHLSHIAIVGRNFSGTEAQAMGIVSQAVPGDALESHVLQIAHEIASRHPAPLEHHKIAVQMGRDLSLAQSIQLDQLVGQRMRHAVDPLDDVEGYLESQKGSPNLSYKRRDV